MNLAPEGSKAVVGADQQGRIGGEVASFLPFRDATNARESRFE